MTSDPILYAARRAGTGQGAGTGERIRDYARWTRFRDGLTTMPHKAALYDIEGYAPAVWSARLRHLPASALTDITTNWTMIVLRPELAALRRTEDCLRLLTEAGFTPVCAEAIDFGRTCERMWRYQWNAATEGRIRIARILFAQHPCLLVVLRRPGGGVPASVDLARLKGSSNPAQRGPRTLRTRLAAPNQVLGLVHTPDEPLDFLRELELLGATRRFLNRYTALSLRDTAANVEEVARVAYAWDADQKPREFDAQAELAALRKRCERTAPPELSARLDAMACGNQVDWMAFISLLLEVGIELEPWIEITLGAEFAITNTGAASLLSAPSYQDWRSRSDSESAPS